MQSLPPSTRRLQRYLGCRIPDDEKPLRQIVENTGLLLTTEVMVADAPKDGAEHAHGPPSGGMGHMGM